MSNKDSPYNMFLLDKSKFSLTCNEDIKEQQLKYYTGIMDKLLHNAYAETRRKRLRVTRIISSIILTFLLVLFFFLN